MEILLTSVGCLIGLVGIVWLAKDLTKSYIVSRKRKRLESEVRAMADDLSTDPEGLSLKEAVDLFGVEMLEEVVAELRKMPVGSRSLQRAIDNWRAS